MRNGDRPFTTPGLGDRIHSVLLGHLYSLLHDDKVTIHLTADKNDKPRKQQSWPEIISLFPDNVTYKESIIDAIRSIQVEKNDIILITGSLYLAGEVLNLN